MLLIHLLKVAKHLRQLVQANFARRYHETEAGLQASTQSGPCRAGLIAVISPAAASECDLFARVCILIKCPTPLSTLSAFRLALLFITKTFLFMSLFFKH